MTNLSEMQPDIGELIAGLAPEQLPDAHDVAAARERLDWRRAQALKRAAPDTIDDPASAQARRAVWHASRCPGG